MENKRSEINVYLDKAPVAGEMGDEEISKDPIYEDLKEILQIYTIDKFENYIREKAVVLLDAKEDLLEFCIKAIDDEIEELKEYNKNKKFVNFTEEMIEKVSEGEKFYTVTIQPYLVVQLKKNRDEFVASQIQEDEPVTPEEEEPTE